MSTNLLLHPTARQTVYKVREDGRCLQIQGGEGGAEQMEEKGRKESGKTDKYIMLVESK